MAFEYVYYIESREYAHALSKYNHKYYNNIINICIIIHIHTCTYIIHTHILRTCIRMHKNNTIWHSNEYIVYWIPGGRADGRMCNHKYYTAVVHACMYDHTHSCMHIHNANAYVHTHICLHTCIRMHKITQHNIQIHIIYWIPGVRAHSSSKHNHKYYTYVIHIHACTYIIHTHILRTCIRVHA